MEITEFKVRALVTEMAKDILEHEDILRNLGISHAEYLNISRTRTFKDMYSAATTEWQGANNTPKRARLKAAVITEELMTKLYFEARDSETESLTAKNKTLEIISKIAGLGAPDPVQTQTNAASFQLVINYANGAKQDSVEIGGQPILVLEGEAEEIEDSEASSEEVTPGVDDWEDL